MSARSAGHGTSDLVGETVFSVPDYTGRKGIAAFRFIRGNAKPLAKIIEDKSEFA